MFKDYQFWFWRFSANSAIDNAGDCLWSKQWCPILDLSECLSAHSSIWRTFFRILFVLSPHTGLYYSTWVNNGHHLSCSEQCTCRPEASAPEPLSLLFFGPAIVFTIEQQVQKLVFLIPILREQLLDEMMDSCLSGECLSVRCVQSWNWNAKDFSS